MANSNVTIVSDQILKKIYDSGNWSNICFFAIIIILNFNGNFIIYSATFTAGSMNFYCRLKNLTSANNSCTVWDSVENKNWSCSNEFEFYPEKNFVKNSIISHFQLVCDRKFLSGLSQSLVIWGMVMGGFIGPIVGDYFGRKKVLISSLFFSGILGISISFCNKYVPFAVGKCGLGFLREISMTNGFVLAMEVIPSTKQSFYGMISQMIWCISISMIGVFGYFIRDWRNLQIAGSIPTLLSPFMLLVVSESPRWLISRRKYEDLKSINTTFIRKWNKVVIEEFEDLINKLQIDNQTTKVNERENQPRKIYLFDLFKSKYIVCWTAILTISWIYCVTAAYSLNFITTLVAGNVYLNFSVSSLLDSFGILLSYACTHKARNLTIFSFQFVSFLSFLVAGFLSEHFKYITTVLIILGKSALNGTQFILSISGLYIYPSTFRLLGLSFSTTVAKTVAISSPYFVELFKVIKWLPTVILGSLAFIVGLLNILFPDWINRPLPETVEDIENLKSYIGLIPKKHKIDKEISIVDV